MSWGAKRVFASWTPMSGGPSTMTPKEISSCAYAGRGEALQLAQIATAILALARRRRGFHYAAGSP
jgi:hypothetical protein